MKKTMKKLAAFMAAASVAGTAIMGCGSASAGSAGQKAGQSGQESGTAGEAAGETAEGAVHVGIIFTEAGLGGNSFNDLALEGVKKAAKDFGITYDEVEPKSVSDEEIIQDEMASSGDYDLIICVGAEQVDALTNVAATYPEQRFALLDADSDLSNVASYSCKEQEGAFLAGAWQPWPSRKPLTVSWGTAGPSVSSAAWTIPLSTGLQQAIRPEPGT